MAKTSNEARLAQAIYQHIGGPDNVSKVYNCMTRVRINIKDDQQVDMEALKQVDGVMSVVEDGDTLQVVVGPGTAAKVATVMADQGRVQQGRQVQENLDHDLTTGRSEAERITAENKNKQKEKNNTPFKQALKVIASIFVPLIPAFVGAGIIGGIASIIQNMLTAGTLEPGMWDNIFLVLKILQNGLFAYLNIYIGINAARVFGATEGLGGVVAGVTYLTGMLSEAPLPNIFTGGDLAAGQGGVIGVIIAVYLLSLVEKGLRKVIPDAIDIIVTPTISLLVVGMMTIFLIMPIAGFVSTSLVGAINWILQVGGAFALWLKCRRNKQLTNIIKGSLPVGILGIGEPLIYAVTLPLGRPFVTACLGGGIGGAVLGAIGGVGATAIGPSGVALIPLIADGQWPAYVMGLVAAYIGGFILTYFFGVPQTAQEASEITGSPSDTMEALDNL